jgi:hypothetical protein
MMPHAARPEILMATVLGAFSLALESACTAHEEPRPAPLVARRLGGDSLAPGAMVIYCRPDDEACVPTYAVACPAPTTGDSGATSPKGPPLSPQEEAFCMANATDSGTGRNR